MLKTKTMDFQTVNSLNVRLNVLSGNLLPTDSDDALFSVMWRIYSVVIWLIEAIQISAIIPGIMLVSIEKIIQDSTVGIVVTLEVFFLYWQMHMSRSLICQLIYKLNDVLRTEDKTMKTIVKSTLKPVEAPLKFYCITGTGSLIVWCCIPFMLVLRKERFFYEDYRLPMVLLKQPFSTEIFLLGNFLACISSIYIFIKKVALDVYMINLVLLITAQYRYISVKLAMILQEDALQDHHDKSENENHFSIEKEMRLLCQHHRAVVQMTLMLKKLLSFNMSLLYLTNVFIFCFLNVMLISAVLSKASIEGFMIVMYISSGLVQLYILCLCVHQLLDASKDITEKAFHEKWYEFRPSLKYMFMMMIISNNLECKLSATNKFNLSLPSFMTILNQSYSFALLFLKVK